MDLTVSLFTILSVLITVLGVIIVVVCLLVLFKHKQQVSELQTTYDTNEKSISQLQGLIAKDDPRYLAASYTFATLFSDHKGHVAEDLDNLYKALSIYKDLGDSARISAVYRYIGEALGDLQMYQNAYDFFYRAIKIAGDCDDVYEESRGYNSLFEYTMVDF